MNRISFTPLFFSLCFVFSFSFLSGQSCGCDHTLTGLNPNSVNIINASNFNYSPGDVFCIQADTVAGLRFVDFQGTASQPLVFKNCNGKVVVSESNYSGIAFVNSQYVHLTGTGDPLHEYGFEVMQTGGGSMGVNFGYLSSDAEVDHIDIHDTGFAGIMAKTDPNCNDTLTWRRNGYVFRNLKIHHNYIHDTEGEGMYIGYTGGYKVASNKICNGDTVFGHWLENVDIHDNILEECGWDAIQVNLGQGDCRVHDNWIRNPGVADETFQNFAMSIGGGIYQIYNNYIFNTPGMPGKGMQMISGESGCKLYNNVFVDLKGNAMFLHNRHPYDDPNLGYAILNNTIVRPGESAIKYNSTITTSVDPNQVGEKQDEVPLFFHNNFVAQPVCGYDTMNFWKDEAECYFDFNNKSTRDSQVVRITHNMMTRRLDTLALADTLNNDYSPTALSPLVDAGLDVSSFGVTFDLNNINRPMGNGFDIGAYEWSPVLGRDELQQGLSVGPNPSSGLVRLYSPVPVAEVLVYDILGHVEAVPVREMEVDLRHLPSGIYWMRVTRSDGSIVVEKLVLQ